MTARFAGSRHERGIVMSVTRVVGSGALCGFLLCLILVMGCGGLGLSMKDESGLLPKPGALVELKDVTNATGQTFDGDVEAMLRGAMRTALQDERLQWTNGSQPHRFGLDLRIVEYRPGNAFKRWLLPGYGSTVLGVEGILRDAQTGATAATFVHERSVHFGGAYTIGAWSYVFDDVADDIAHGLKIRIEQGGQFLVYLKPRADQSAAPQPSERAAKIRLASVTDDRVEKRRIGTREAAFGVSMGDVYLGQKPVEMMRQALRDDLSAAGYRIVESGQDLVAEGRLRKFWVHTDTTAFYWDVVGDIEFSLAVSPATQQEPVSKTFTCHHVERTYVWPSTGLLGTVLDACLEDMMLKVRSDEILKRAVH